MEDANNKYYSYFDLDDTNNSHSLAVNLIGRDKLVLEIGCSTGFVSKILKEKGCRVIGIDIDKQALDNANKYCEKTFCMDIEKADLKELNVFKELYDVIYMGDIIEHLKAPEQILPKLRKLLKNEGYLVASIPNIAHGSVRLSLLNGKFNYLERGLLDKTHLRFFTKQTIKKLFQESNFIISRVQSTKLDYDKTEIVIDTNQYEKDLIEKLKSDEESFVYQYIIKAYKNDRNGYVESMKEKVEQLELGMLDQRDRIHQKEAEVLQLKERINQQEAEISKQEEMIQQQEVEASKQEEMIQQQEVEASKQEEMIQQQEAEVSKLKDMINHKEAEASKLKERIQEQDVEALKREERIHQQEVEASKLEKKIKKQEAETLKLKEEINQQEERIEEEIHYNNISAAKIDGLKHELQCRNNQIEELNELLRAVTSTKGWIYLDKLRKIKRMINRGE